MKLTSCPSDAQKDAKEPEFSQQTFYSEQQSIFCISLSDLNSKNVRLISASLMHDPDCTFDRKSTIFISIWNAHSAQTVKALLQNRSLQEKNYPIRISILQSETAAIEYLQQCKEMAKKYTVKNFDQLLTEKFSQNRIESERIRQHFLEFQYKFQKSTKSERDQKHLGDKIIIYGVKSEWFMKTCQQFWQKWSNGRRWEQQILAKEGACGFQIIQRNVKLKQQFNDAWKMIKELESLVGVLQRFFEILVV